MAFLTDREKVLNLLNAAEIDNEILVAEILDLMFYARRDGYYRAYDEVKSQKAYEERMSKSIEQKIAEGLYDFS